MKYLILIALIITSSCQSTKEDTLTKAQIEEDTKAIKEVLFKQARDWSTASIDAFMEGYENSENLLFVGKNGMVKGWQQTLDGYKERYPTKDHTGNLTFEVIDVQPINSGAYILVGKFFLKRNLNNTSGIFTLVFKKVDNQWKVIADHTSAYDND